VPRPIIMFDTVPKRANKIIKDRTLQLLLLVPHLTRLSVNISMRSRKRNVATAANYLSVVGDGTNCSY